MKCPHCQQPLLYCNCHDAAGKIGAFLTSSAGKRLAIPVYNSLVQRAAAILDKRISANMEEAFRRFPDLDRRSNRPRKMWKKPK